MGLKQRRRARCINGEVGLSATSEEQERLHLSSEFSAGSHFVSHDPCISPELQGKHGLQITGECSLGGLCMAGARTWDMEERAEIIQIFAKLPGNVFF